MKHSRQVPVVTACPDCGQATSATPWVLINLDEEPSLASDLRAGTLNVVVCPAGHLIDLDVPVLIHDHARRRLTFIESHSVSKEENRSLQQYFMDFLEGLLNTTGSAHELHLPIGMPIKGCVIDDADQSMLATAQRRLDEHTVTALVSQVFEGAEGDDDAQERIDRCRRLLSQANPELDRAGRAVINLTLGNLLLNAPILTDEASLVEARALDVINVLEEGLSLLPHGDGVGNLRPPALIDLAIAYTNLHADRAENNELAIALLLEAESALAAGEPDDTRLQLLYCKLGHCLRIRAAGHVLPALRESVAAYEKAFAKSHPTAPRSEMAEVENGLLRALAELVVLDPVPSRQYLDCAFELRQHVLGQASKIDDDDHWAKAQFSLGTIFLAYGASQSSTTPVLRSAVECFESALETFTFASDVANWARGLMNIASAIALSGGNDAALPIARGVSACEEVLAARSAIDELTVARANITYAELLLADDDAAEPTVLAADQAITDALAVSALKDFPPEWAKAQALRGAARRRTAGASDHSRMQEALIAYETALSNAALDDFATDWWEAQRAVIEICIETEAAGGAERGLAAVNEVVERAIRRGTREAYLCAMALRVTFCRATGLRHDREFVELTVTQSSKAAEGGCAREDRLAWTILQNAIGELHACCAWDLADGIERAITAFNAALTVISPDSDMEAWATVRHNLAEAHLNRPKGDPASNIEMCIAILENVIEVLGSTSPLPVFASCSASLGLAYTMRSRGDREKNSETAIALLEQARSHPSKRSLLDTAIMDSSFATAYGARAGTRASNAEHAITLHRSAIDLFTRVGERQRATRAYINLGIEYLFRESCDHADNMDTATGLFETAMRLAPETCHREWSAAAGLLAQALSDSSRVNRTDSARALRLCRRAAALQDRAASPHWWAESQCAIANIFTTLSRTGKSSYVTRAIAAYRRALTAFEPATNSPPSAQIQLSLAGLHMKLAANDGRHMGLARKSLKCAEDATARDEQPDLWARIRIAGADMLLWQDVARRATVRRAIGLFESARAVYNVEQYPKECVKVCRKLATAYLLLGDLESARSVLLTAVEGIERSYRYQVTDLGRTGELQETADLLKMFVDVCLKVSPPQVESAYDADNLMRARVLRDQLALAEMPAPSTIETPLLEQERVLLSDIRGIQRSLDFETGSDRRQEPLRHLERSISQVSRLWDAMTSQSAEGAEYVSLRRGGTVGFRSLKIALASSARRIAVVQFCNLADRLVLFLASGDREQPIALSVPFDRYQTLHMAHRFRAESQDLLMTRSTATEWERFSAAVLAQLLPHLGGIDVVYLVPDEWLHAVPLHAIEANGVCLLDSHAVAYSLSSDLIARTMQGNQISALAEASLLILSDPTGDLPWAKAEAKRVQAMTNAKVLSGRECSAERVLNEIAAADSVHFAGHSRFVPKNPFASGLVLHGGDILTARELLAARVKLRLVVISGCDSGVQSIGPSNELTGLARALMYAGAGSLVMSLWPVIDAAAAELMDVFYKSLYPASGQGSSFADALRLAMLAVRQNRPSLLQWAPFALIGDWRGHS
jgi:CHAT domain-containing protein/tetratricopeptide (TPR) repeat protein